MKAFLALALAINVAATMIASRHPQLAAPAALDMTVTVTALYYWLIVRPGLRPQKSLLFVALLEYRDTALRTESEVWDLTHLPTLAIIAWSDAAAIDAPPPSRLKRLFGRKTPKDVLAGAQG